MVVKAIKKNTFLTQGRIYINLLYTIQYHYFFLLLKNQRNKKKMYYSLYINQAPFQAVKISAKFV